MFIDEDPDTSTEHYPGVNSQDEVTLNYSQGDVQSWCYNSGNPKDVIKSVAYCTQNKVRDYIDNNGPW